MPILSPAVSATAHLTPDAEAVHCEAEFAAFYAAHGTMRAAVRAHLAAGGAPEGIARIVRANTPFAFSPAVVSALKDLSPAAVTRARLVLLMQRAGLARALIQSPAHALQSATRRIENLEAERQAFPTWLAESKGQDEIEWRLARLDLQEFILRVIEQAAFQEALSGQPGTTQTLLAGAHLAEERVAQFAVPMTAPGAPVATRDSLPVLATPARVRAGRSR